MDYIHGFLTRSELGAVCDDALSAYIPGRNDLDLSRSATLETVRRKIEIRLGEKLNYFGAFLLLVSDTTIETAANNVSEGWHVDGSSISVSGDCYNVWIPLYNSSRHSGLEVIPQKENAWVYHHLCCPISELDIYVKTSAGHIFDSIAAGIDADLLLLRRDIRKSLILKWEQLHLARFHTPIAGDIALFRQNEIHRGIHQGGIRIQLSLKLISERSVDLRIKSVAAEPTKILSKHGRLEVQIVRELLALQAAACKGSSVSPSKALEF